MPDDRIYDAINLFKYSPTGTGNADIRGDRAYQAKYRRLAEDVLTRLWQLWGSEAIGFAKLGNDFIGNSFDSDRPGGRIQVNVALEPARNPIDYASPESQGKLAAASCAMVHEAVHLVHSAVYPEEEVLCRTIQVSYFHDLQSPRSYRSRVTGAGCSAQYLPTTGFYRDMKERYLHSRARDLVDEVFATPEYRYDLTSSETAAFIARSLDWWGGPSARWAGTRGYYLRSLAAHGSLYGTSILELLESLSSSQWEVAKTCAGSLHRISGALVYQWTDPKLRAVELRLGESFRSPRWLL